MSLEKMVVEEVDDPQKLARFRYGQVRFEANRDWLESHWQDVLPQAAGRFLAVAGQEAFVTDSIDAAWKWVEEHHSDDEGAFVRFVRSQQGPRFCVWRVFLAA